MKDHKEHDLKDHKEHDLKDRREHDLNDQGGSVKAWRCPGKEHVLGLVRRNGRGIRQLWLYRQAVDDRAPLDSDESTSAGEMAEVDVMAVVEGLALDVRCSICGEMRTWVPGEEAIRRLIEGRGR